MWLLFQFCTHQSRLGSSFSKTSQIRCILMHDFQRKGCKVKTSRKILNKNKNKGLNDTIKAETEDQS